ncbi:MAG: histidine phosphatase family protein, partial [Kiloniellaceae bacterium]
MILIRHGQSEFNIVFNVTRVDPGIIDPGLTDEGLRQADSAADALGQHDIHRVLTSPYARALHTAEIIAERRGLRVRIEPLVRERAVFACDIGSPRSHLAERWPAFDFGELRERWWPQAEETEDELRARCAVFRDLMAESEDWAHVAVISHWGFIRALTGQAVA